MIKRDKMSNSVSWHQVDTQLMLGTRLLLEVLRYVFLTKCNSVVYRTEMFHYWWHYAIKDPA